MDLRLRPMMLWFSFGGILHKAAAWGAIRGVEDF